MELRLDEDAMKKVVAFLSKVATLDESKLNHAQQCFPRALHSIYRRAQETGNVAAAVVAFYDGETTFRVFDNLADAIEAAIEYKEENAPYVVFSMTNVEVEG